MFMGVQHALSLFPPNPAFTEPPNVSFSIIALARSLSKEAFNSPLGKSSSNALPVH